MSFPRSEYLFDFVLIVAAANKAAADQAWADMQQELLETIGTTFNYQLPPIQYGPDLQPLEPIPTPTHYYASSSMSEAMRLGWLSAIASTPVTTYQFCNPNLAVAQKAEVFYTLLGLPQQDAEALADDSYDLILLSTNAGGTLQPGDRISNVQGAIADFVGSLNA